ncbi:MAG TPA: zinc ribbon domain-containing protein [Sedimentisphaerales bacterium]|nr:zinc ribbon domain-containing protein [Sedimentisphaerales bacterium]
MGTKRCPLCAEKIQAKAVKCRYCGSNLVNLENSLIAAHGEKRKKKSISGRVAFLVIVAIIVGCFARWRQEPTERAERRPVRREQKPTEEKPQYEVVDRKTIDTEIKTQVTIHAVVSGTLTESGLKQVLEKMYDEANATRGFEYFDGKPTHIAIWLYTSEDDFKSSTPNWIANLQRIGIGSKPEIKVKRELLAHHNAAPQVKYNLSEAKRKEIYKALIAASDRAEAEAERRYPWPGPNHSQAEAEEQIRKNAEALDTLREEYKSEVAANYGITQEQRKEINWEGDLKEWPMPPRR